MAPPAPATTPAVRLLRRAFSRLTVVTAPTGEAVLDWLERDLAAVTSLDRGWRRLCSAAWALGFTSVQLQPTPEFASSLRPRDELGPWRDPGAGRQGANFDTAWSFTLRVEGRHAATLTVRLGYCMLDFNPGRFAQIAQELATRFSVHGDGGD